MKEYIVTVMKIGSEQYSVAAKDEKTAEILFHMGDRKLIRKTDCEKQIEEIKEVKI